MTNRFWMRRGSSLILRKFGARQSRGQALIGLIRRLVLKAATFGGSSPCYLRADLCDRVVAHEATGHPRRLRAQRRFTRWLRSGALLTDKKSSLWEEPVSWADGAHRDVQRIGLETRSEVPSPAGFPAPNKISWAAASSDTDGNDACHSRKDQPTRSSVQCRAL